jgi:glycosyltransferase involved in cell wall biosynthesis
MERHKYYLPTNTICAIYPGSWDFLVRNETGGSSSDQVTFLHSGTLYSNRNLDLFFRALDELRESGHALASRVKVANQGDLALENADEYRQRGDFSELRMTARGEALQIAARADFLLLVQHSDSRSEETIPYKTYDYLNIGVTIFGLTNSSELNQILESSGGFYADNRDVASIKEILIQALAAHENKSTKSRALLRLDISEQFSKVFMVSKSIRSAT